jgi:porin
MKTCFNKRNFRITGFFAGMFFAGSAVLYADPVDIPDPINILTQQRLLGEFKGYRPQMETNGVVMTLQSISDLLGNVQGGQKEGGTYSGLLNLGMAVDLQKATGWEGASFKNTWLWLYGNDVSQNFIGNAFTASSIAGQPAFRCYELWFQQNLFHDVVSLRGGLIPFDTEFMTSETANLFVNTAFGPMALVTLNLPNGGPQYPMATPGVRLALQPTSWLTLCSAFMEANPLEQENNLHNFNWNFGSAGGLLNINEGAAIWNKDPASKGLPGTAKIGCWFQTGQSLQSGDDETFSYGSPSAVAYSSGFYGIIDQQLYRPADKTADAYSSKNPVVTGKNAVPTCDCSCKGLSSFAQVGFDPQEVCVSSFYTSAGFVYTGLIPTRDADRLGISFAYANISNYLKNKADAAGASGASFEAVSELTYSIRLAPAIAIQPDVQYIMHPGGTRDYGNALVVGIRAVVDF